MYAEEVYDTCTMYILTSPPQEVTQLKPAKELHQMLNSTRIAKELI